MADVNEDDHGKRLHAYVKTVDALPALGFLVEAIKHADVVCFDLETASDLKASHDWHDHSRVVCASFTVPAMPDTGYVVPLSHPQATWGVIGLSWKDVLLDLARAMVGKKLVGHNLKYDVRWVHSMTGIDLNEWQWFDTMLAAHLLDENAPKDLGSCGEQYLGVETWKKTVDLNNPEAVPWADLSKYNAQDTVGNLALVAPMKEALLEEPSLGRLYKFLMLPASRALVRAERTGMLLDVPELEARVEELESSIEERAERLWEDYVPPDLKAKHSSGLIRAWKDEDGRLQVVAPDLRPTWSANGKFFSELMAALDVPVLERTPKKGTPSWKEGVMKRLALEGDYPFVEDVLAMRHEEKELTGFLRPWLDMRSNQDRLHPTFKPANVATGRLSASEPNPQQIAKGLKKFFPGPDGWAVVQADYSQVELRIAAELADEENMLQAYREGKDLHRIMAASIAGKALHEVTPEERSRAKPVNFGFLYGMGWKNFLDFAFEQYGVIFTPEEAREVRALFFRTWPGLARWHEEQRRLAFVNGYVRSPLGRRRRLPDIYSPIDGIAAMAERQGINAPVQSYASDLMLLSISTMDRVLDPRDALIVCTVHDSVILYVRRGRIQDTVRKMAQAMLYPPIERYFGARPLRVPLAVEFEVGRSWYDPEAQVIEVSTLSHPRDTLVLEKGR